MKTSGSPWPASSACSVTPSSVTIAAMSILRAASDAPSDSRAARIWKFSSTGPSSGAATVKPRWVSQTSSPSDSSRRIASRTGVWLTPNRWARSRWRSCSPAASSPVMTSSRMSAATRSVLLT